MSKERFYKSVIVILLALIIVMGLVMLLKKTPRKISKPPFPKITKHIKGKIAIVIDDLGYTMANLNIIENVKYPVTFSVLPELDFSESAARKLNSLGFQIILHLPMEPQEKKNLEENTILTSMDATRIKSIIETDLAAVPNLIGVSNHMGSKATEDEKTMSEIFDVLKNKHIFFLDSFVTTKSIAKQVAARKKLKFVQRDVFLDNSLDPVDIHRQIEQLKQKAMDKGQAVGIGHDRKTTFEVLKDEMPKMEKEGFKFVFVSELVR